MRPNLSRRNFIAASSGILLSAAANPAYSNIVEGARKISFDCLHTGEKLNVEYWAKGRYIPGALAEVDKVLRDFRTGDIHPIAPELLDLLAKLHSVLNSRARFQVISGYRSPHTNTLLHKQSAGVANHSLHMQGMAIDIRLGDRSLTDLHLAALSLKGGGVGYYPQSDFLHVDVGRLRRW